MWECDENYAKLETNQEAEKEARKEVSRTGTAPGSESGAGAAEEQSTRRTRQAVPKWPGASAFQGELSQKKVRKGFEAAASAQMPEIIPSGIEEKKKEEDEEEEEMVSALHFRGLRCRGPAVLADVELACLFAVAEGVVVTE